MEILIRILTEKLMRGEINLEIDREAISTVEKECIIVLGRIRTILADDSLDDPECFERIERIVCEMESIGLNCGSRHDFG